MKKKAIPLLILYTVMAISNANRGVPKVTLKSDRVTIEYGSDVSINPEEYVNIENPQFMSSIGFKSALISDTNNYSINETTETVISRNSQYLDVGTYDSYIVYAKEALPVRIEIVDTTPPVFKNFKDTVTIPVNSKKEDLEKLFRATDLSDVSIVITDDKVEYDKVGKYKIKVTAIDAHLNKTEKKCTVNIVSEEEYKKIGLAGITEKEEHKENARIIEEEYYVETPIIIPETQVVTQQAPVATIQASEEVNVEPVEQQNPVEQEANTPVSDEVEGGSLPIETENVITEPAIENFFEENIEESSEKQLISE